ncbi:MAG: hypothetical protein HC833_10755 [Leptolyngbyaceae cyanobacterium RM1_406_9]|nr:hypothetical protein [Leptolyngbyaceae cyanobacterium RM1_406_9]
MNQLSLFPISVPSEVAACVVWCRPSGRLFAVGLRSPTPPTVLGWFSQSCEVLAVEPLPRSVALLVRVPAELSPAFLALPAPRGGSRHESNRLSF